MFSTAASQLARSVDASLLWIVAICTALFLGIVAMLVTFTIRYRRSMRGRVQQVHGHLALEITWTVVPVGIVMGMFWLGYRDFPHQQILPCAHPAPSTA